MRKCLTRISLIIICIITFLSRTLGQWSKVFVDGAVIFRGQDSWYHMRLAQVLKANFPNYLHNDYFVNPSGQPPAGYPPFLTGLIATPTLPFSERITEIWGALLPPLLAVGTVVVVYFLAKTVLRSRGYALVAALLVGVLPTQFFQKTLLGFTDHHMLEVFFFSLSLLLLFKKKYLLLGLALGALSWTWAGAGYIILVLTFGVAVAMYQKRLRGVKITRLGLGFAFALSIAGLLFSLIGKNSVTRTESLACLVVGALIPLTLLALNHIRNTKVFAYAAPLIGVLALINLWIFLPITSWWGAVFNRGSSAVIGEMTPLTFTSAFSNFGLILLLAIPGLIIFLRKERSWILPAVTIPLLISSINQIRFTYYLVIPAVLFSTYFIVYISSKLRENAKLAVSITIIIFIFMTSLVNIIKTAAFENTMSPNMYTALTWIRYNTPEPGGNWYSLQSNPSDYQVLAWWDYGSWVAYVSRRTPLTSPQGAYLPQMTEFWLDGDIDKLEQHAEKVYGDGNVNVRYVVLEKSDMKVDWVKHLTGETEQNRLWIFDSREWYWAYSNSEVFVLESR